MTDQHARALDILLVDDSEDDVFLMKEALVSERILNIVHTASSGEQALAYLRQRSVKPALVLLDINMPGMTGFDVLKEMKADPRLAALPTVMLTTSQSELDIVRSYSEGACSFITKPLDIQKLREIAESFSLYWTLVARVPEQRNGSGDQQPGRLSHGPGGHQGS